MQEALDSAALMLSKEANGLSATDLQTKGGTYFKALYTDPAAQNVSVKRHLHCQHLSRFNLDHERYPRDAHRLPVHGWL